MTLSQIIALIVFLFPLAYSPGPGNLSFAAASASNGMKATINANIGYHIAAVFLTMLIGFGFGWLLPQGSVVLKYIGYAGSLYVVYLGLKFLRAGFSKIELKSVTLSFVDGVILMFLNPKAYLIIFLIFSQFKALPEQNNWLFIVVLSVVFTLNNVVAFVVWAYAGMSITKLLQSEKAQKRLNVIFGILLILVAIKLNF